MKLCSGDILIYNLYNNEIRLFDSCMLEKTSKRELSVPINLAPELTEFDYRHIMVPTLNTVLELIACFSGLRVTINFEDLGRVTAKFLRMEV